MRTRKSAQSDLNLRWRGGGYGGVGGGGGGGVGTMPEGAFSDVSAQLFVQGFIFSEN